MRLWHETLIPYLPRQQLLGQHRECCALRGNGWNKKHATVNYIFGYSPYRLFAYHQLIMDEMSQRGYKVGDEWLDKNYRGKQCLPYSDLEIEATTSPVYPEHDRDYLKECLENLAKKDIFLDNFAER